MRRITSLMLALVLLAGVLFAGAFSVSAESDLTTSADAITMLKKYEGFSKYPYWDVAQWTVGYGTCCPADKLDYYKNNGITEAEAEVLLRNYVSRYERDVNYFADKYGITFKQQEFDALILFSYNCGSGWVYSPSQNFHQAVANRKTGNDLIYWFSRWCTAGGSILTPLVNRRLCEANLYLNGQYSTSRPSNFCYVIYDANGGEIDGRVQGYDANLSVDFANKPTKGNQYFQGWYTAKTGGSKVTQLSTAVDGMTLYAHWGDGPATDDEEVYDPEIVTVTGDSVNVRKGPGTNYSTVGSYSRGDKVGITETQTVGERVWGKCPKGWIALEYTTYGKPDAELPEEDETEEEETTSVMGTVKANGGLTIRSGAGTGYGSLGSYPNGARVEILEQKTAGSMIWGKTEKGWISLSYVVLDKTEEEEKPTTPPADTEDEEEETPASVTGTVTGNSVRIRSGAGTSYGIVGYYNAGNKVTITERKTVGSMTWGKTAKGWISMNYVKLDAASEDEEEEQQPTEPEDTTPKAVTGTVKVSDSLNVRSGPGTTYAIAGFLYNGNKVTITEQKTVGSVTWGKTEKGWVSMAYIVLDSQEEDKPQQTPDTDDNEDSGSTGTESTSVTGTVRVNDYLSIRSGAGTNFGTVGYYYNGNKVTVTERKSVSGTEWGKTDKGWICLKYVVLDEEEQTVIKTIIADTLNVRSGAGTTYGIVGYVNYGAKVEILETKTVNGTTWGRISTGWISMDYVK